MIISLLIEETDNINTKLSSILANISKILKSIFQKTNILLTYNSQTKKLVIKESKLLGGKDLLSSIDDKTINNIKKYFDSAGSFIIKNKNYFKNENFDFKELSFSMQGTSSFKTYITDPSIKGWSNDEGYFLGYI